MLETGRVINNAKVFAPRAKRFLSCNRAAVSRYGTITWNEIVDFSGSRISTVG